MTTYCEACGFKNVYAGVKPKKCSSCEEPLGPKAIAHHEREKTRQPRYREEEVYEPEVLPDFDVEAVKKSIQLEPDGNEGQFMTVGKFREGGGGLDERGGPPVRELPDENGAWNRIKSEAFGGGEGTIGGLLGQSAIPKSGPVPNQPRSTSRKMKQRIALPQN